MRLRSLLLLPALGFSSSGCSALETFNEACPDEASVIGETTVPLDVRKVTLRTEEAPLGNLMADALLGTARVADPAIDGALQNAGGLRPELCGGGSRDVIPAGTITDADVDQLLPFENYLTVVTLSGTQLRSVLERGVSSIPDEAEGWFPQVAGFAFVADCAQPPQVLSADGLSVATEGSRVIGITFDGVPWSADATYRIATNDYVAAGEDGFLAMKGGSTTSTSEVYADVLKGWIESHTPVSPEVEGRITLTSSCSPAL